MNITKLKKVIFRKISIIITVIIMTICPNIVSATEVSTQTNNWNEWKERSYWEWHTRTTTNDKAYNGEHIKIDEKDDVIRFYGYGQNSYKDFLYKDYENPGEKTFRFVIDETKGNYHTLDGAGFIVNADIESDMLSGYILLFNEKNISLYRVDNIDVKKFETTSNKTVEMYAKESGKIITQVPKTSNTLHNLIVTATPDKIIVNENGSELINEELDQSKHVGNSFGLISSYVQHDCNKLTQIEFSEFEMAIKDFDLTLINTDLEFNRLTGGYFKVKDEYGNIVQIGRTNRNGEMDVKELDEGIYTVEQTRAPSEYQINEEVFTFVVDKEGQSKDYESEEEINKIVIKNDKEEIEEDIVAVIEEEPEEPQEEVEEVDEVVEKEIIAPKKEDVTTAPIIIPYTGKKIVILTFILIAIITSIYFFIKLRGNKNM